MIRRTNYEEKYLIIVKQRQGHTCYSTFIVVCIVVWDGILRNDADDIYATLTDKLSKYGLETQRKCETNEQRNCACQGLSSRTCGASFSFGCSWSMYFAGCKFARSKLARKFRLKMENQEDLLEEKFQKLATDITPLYKTLAPISFQYQCENEDEAKDCRLGKTKGRPFSGVTACLDYCAHSHKDSNNIDNDCTVVVTLTKERHMNKHQDEQLHVLPLYAIDGTDEYGSEEYQQSKIKNGSIEILNK